MEFIEFEKITKSELSKININATDKQINQLYLYMNLLIEWNEKINLTAIVEPKDIIIKHFIDSLTIEKYIKKDSKLIDVGTGAGFPGIPLKIFRNDVNIVLLDSLNKRVKFLEEVIKKLELKDIYVFHGRAEEFSIKREYRETFDIATSRAVANMATLSEYLLPFVKIGGKMIAMKGSEIEEELEESKYAISVLGGKTENIDSFLLLDTDIKRNIVIIKKEKKTPEKYPRKAGAASKEPLKKKS